MTTSGPSRAQLAEELLRRFVATIRAAQLYSTEHPLVARNVDALAGRIEQLHALQPALVIGVVGDEIVVDDRPIAKADTLGGLARRLQDIRHRAHHHRTRRDARRARDVREGGRKPGADANR